MPIHRGPVAGAGALILLISLPLWAGCGDPEVDDPRSRGGTAPDPSAVIESGAFLYVGPPPRCRYEAGQPVEPIGRAILSLFDADNPPPPQGSASSALNLLSIPGDRLFPDLADCMPEDPSPADRDRRITRSVPFVWAEIALHPERRTTYEIRAFYDRDGDFVPFFRARNQPTRGDVVGGAIADDGMGLARIAVGSQRDNPRGIVISGVTVMVAAVVNTEVPLFTLEGAPKLLSAEATVPIMPDLPLMEQALDDLMGLDALLLTDTDPMVPPALLAAGIDPSFEPFAHAFFVRAVDANLDGAPDHHPVLGRFFDWPWITPLVLLRRRRSPAEIAAGIPEVMIVGSPPPASLGMRRTVAPRLDLLLPPVALISLSDDPALPQCRVPVFAPGNVADLLEASPSLCQELPTGWYETTLMQGLANAEAVIESDPLLADNGWDLRGGLPVTQAWTVPNELGDPGQVDVNLPNQGPAGLIAIHDPDPSNPIGETQDALPCRQAVGLDGSVREIRRPPVDAICCDAVRHLCDLPLCAVSQVEHDGETVNVRLPAVAGPIDCLPFALPESCCGV